MKANEKKAMEHNKSSSRKSKKNGCEPGSVNEFGPSRIKAMIEMLDKVQSEDAPCDEVHALLAQFAEAVTLGEDTSEIMPLVQDHLKLCLGCREEFEAVMEILNSPWGKID
jgi:hypothetical protein